MQNNGLWKVVVDTCKAQAYVRLNLAQRWKRTDAMPPHKEAKPTASSSHVNL